MRYLIFLLLMMGACSRSEAPEQQLVTPVTASASEPSEPAAEQVQPTPDLNTPPSLEVLDQGKPPTKALRHSFKEGSKHVLKVSAEWTLNATVGATGMLVTSVMPRVDYTIEAVAGKVAGDGRTGFTLKVEKVTVKPQKGAAQSQVNICKEAAAAMKGITGTFSINPRGIVEALEISAPPNASPRAYEMVDHIARAIRLASLPLPAEPVGKGAQWTATQVIEQGRVRSEQRSTYELLSATGSRLSTRVAYGQTAPEQTLTPPGSPNDIVYEVHEVHFEGDGKGSWQLGQLAPRLATEHTKTILKMTTIADQPQVVVVGTDVTLKVGTRR